MTSTVNFTTRIQQAIQNTPALITPVPATSTELGSVKVGSGLAIDQFGLLSATGGSGGTTDYNALTNKPTIPTTTSALTNDAGFQTSAQVNSAVTAGINALPTAAKTGSYLDLTNKPQYLSDFINNITIDSYVLPAATQTVLGGVKVGTGLQAANDGTLSVSTAFAATLAGGYSSGTTVLGDDLYLDVMWLMSMDGTNGSSNILDSKAHSITNAGVVLSSTQSKYGTTSAYFNGTSYMDVLGCIDVIGTQDFVFEMDVFLLSLGGGGFSNVAGTLLDTRPSGAVDPQYLLLFVHNDGRLSSYTHGLYTTTTITLNQWHHVAYQRKAGVLSIMLDGVTEASTSMTTSMLTTGMNVIGAPVDGRSNTSYLKLNGYVANARMTVGKSRYTAPFTPPTTQHPTNLTIYGSGGTGSSIQFNADSGLSGDASFVYDATNKSVGINTNTPTERLDVDGYVKTTGVKFGDGTQLTTANQLLIPSQQSASTYVLAATDCGNVVEMDNVAANTVIVPAQSNVAIPVGSQIIITQVGTGMTTIAPGNGVVIRNAHATGNIAAQWGSVSLRKRSTDEWVIEGNLS